MQPEQARDYSLTFVMTLYTIFYLLGTVVFVVMIPPVSRVVYESPISCSAGMSLALVIILHQTKKRLLAMNITKGE